MKKAIVLLVILALVYEQSRGQANNRIIVVVENITSDAGTINVGVFNSEKNFLEIPYKKAIKKAEAGKSIVFEFTGIPNGAYTVSAYHDLNGNGDLDTNFIGIPDEPYGISREGRRAYGPPSYSNAVFRITEENVRLTITLE